MANPPYDSFDAVFDDDFCCITSFFVPDTTVIKIFVDSKE